ncbi:MAG: hypothetical protein F7C09_02505 [Aeropyrum sp.]|nr:hypothetical protein [Aeropyrum sp.]
MGEWQPPFSTRKIVGSYRILKLYLEAARNLGREDLVDKALLKDDDVEALRGLVTQPGISVENLLNALTERFIDRVDGEVAEQALKEAGYNVDRETARRMVARVIAGWLVEAGEEWKIYSLRGSWES